MTATAFVGAAAVLPLVVVALFVALASHRADGSTMMMAAVCLDHL